MNGENILREIQRIVAERENILAKDVGRGTRIGKAAKWIASRFSIPTSTTMTVEEAVREAWEKQQKRKKPLGGRRKG